MSRAVYGDEDTDWDEYVTQQRRIRIERRESWRRITRPILWVFVALVAFMVGVEAGRWIYRTGYSDGYGDCLKKYVLERSE